MLCNLCPRECNTDRSVNAGFCGVGENLKIARAGLHLWEEPCISGTNGSGTVFFSGCSLGCEFCQNSSISHRAFGKEITPDRLYEIFYELYNQGAHNINLVTADHFIPYILPVLKRIKSEHFPLPIILNTSSYLKPSALECISKYIDIYIADLKFYSDAPALKYLGAPDYPEISRNAVSRMVQLTGVPRFENGLLKSGTIIRLLVIPNNIIDAKLTLKHIYSSYGDNVILSLMSQYTPMPNVKHPELKNKLSPVHYKSVVDFAVSLGFKNAYIQDGSSVGDSFIPPFNLQGV